MIYKDSFVQCYSTSLSDIYFKTQLKNTPQPTLPNPIYYTKISDATRNLRLKYFKIYKLFSDDKKDHWLVVCEEFLLWTLLSIDICERDLVGSAFARPDNYIIYFFYIDLGLSDKRKKNH